MSPDATRAWDEMAALLEGIALEHERKVLALARRLRPGLTAEDVRNPHDFGELDDADFNYADGMLAGLREAITALRARRREYDRDER